VAPAAMAAIAIPIPAGWLRDIWTWPEDLYFLLPLTAVCSGVYAFVVVRHLDGVGYGLLWRKADVRTGVANWILFTLVAIPLGYALQFIRFHPSSVSWPTLGLQFVGIYLTITLNATVISSAVIQSAIKDTGVINGQFTLTEAQQIANVLRYGALPIVLKIASEETVGPTLGQDSIVKSAIAAGIGIGIVILFMLIYYRLPGVLADFALLLYAGLTFAIFKFVGVTLSLAGIAGFVLSIGMAVDANVLIF